MPVEIKGLQKVSLIDYPGKICSVVFLSNCNFRCPFCHNLDLVLNPEKLPTIPENEILEFLKTRLKLIDGVCICGGEPTIHEGLPDFIKKIKSLDFLVKLDTNGTNPEMVEFLIKNKLVDYIAMDIKTTLEKYDNVAKVKVNAVDIRKSVDLIRKSGIDYDFRTTVVPGLFDEKTALEIGRWLKGSKRYYLQQFRPETTLDKKYEKKKPYTKEELGEFREMLKPYFEICEVRGV